MTVSKEDLQDFNRFADERLSRGETWSFLDLVREWENARQHESSLAALRESHADAESGRVKPLNEAFAEIRDQLSRSQ